MSAPCSGKVKGLEFLLVLWVDGTAVLERRHLLSRLVKVGLWLFWLCAPVGASREDTL